MSGFSKLALFLLRVGTGWMMFYAGYTKLIDPTWSAASYLTGAKTFPELFNWFLQPSILPAVNLVNEWGLTLLGVSLILGVFVRFASILGAVMMMLYYLPLLQFPYPNAHAYIVDEHIIYALVLLFFAAIRAGRIWGLENWCSNLPICSRFPSYRRLFG